MIFNQTFTDFSRIFRFVSRPYASVSKLIEILSSTSILRRARWRKEPSQLRSRLSLWMIYYNPLYCSEVFLQKSRNWTVERNSCRRNPKSRVDRPSLQSWGQFPRSGRPTFAWTSSSPSPLTSFFQSVPGGHLQIFDSSFSALLTPIVRNNGLSESSRRDLQNACYS